MLKTPTLIDTKNLTPKECRNIIANIPNNSDLASFISRMKTPKKFDIYDCQKFFETMYLLAARVGEVCGRKTETDTNKPTGHTLKVERATYQPDDTILEEIDILTRLLFVQRLRAGNSDAPTLKDVLAIEESIGFFYVQVQKRKDKYVRKTAIPLRDPMVKGVLDYIVERQIESPVFPVNRKQALKMANIIFKGYTYRIKTYWRTINGKRVLVPASYKPVGDHALRHMRLEEVRKLGVRGPFLKAFVGWTITNNDEMEDTYINDELYRCYMPFLLMQKHS